MAIFTRFGSEVEFTEAEQITVLIERTRNAETRWHYPEKLPANRLKTSEYEEVPVWHARAKYVKDGKPICGGGQVPGHEFKADDGWKEIVAAMRAVEKPKS